MRIGLIGGVERNESQYQQIAARLGYTLVFHSGHMGGRGSDVLEDLVRGVNLVIVVTDVNSHGAVILARRAARKYGVPLFLQRRCSPSKLQAILSDLTPGFYGSAIG